MANYQTHVSFGTGAGIAVAVTEAFISHEFSWDIAALCTYFGFIGGMIPDVDHDRGHALSKITDLFTTLFPLIGLALLSSLSGRRLSLILLYTLPAHHLLHHWLGKRQSFTKRTGWNEAVKGLFVAGLCAIPALFLYARLPFDFPKNPLGYIQTWGVMMGIALFVRFSMPIFKKLSVHRGVFHTIPAIVIYAEIVFLVLVQFHIHVRLWVTIAAFAGALSHLVLDEFYSVDFDGRRLRVKRSFGTALSFWKKDYPRSTMLAYLLMGVLGFLCWDFYQKAML